MKLIITIIGIGAIAILNILAIARIESALGEQRREIVEDIFNALDIFSNQITDNRKVTDRKIAELRKFLRQARVDILNEVYVAQAKIHEEGKKTRRELK